MKLRVRLSEGIEAELESSSPKQAFQQVASLNDILCYENCGKCQSPNTYLEYRTVDSYEYYSKRCKDCGAQLDIGQYKDSGRMFVKRSEHRESRGWYMWTDREGKSARDKHVEGGGGGDDTYSQAEAVF